MLSIFLVGCISVFFILVNIINDPDGMQFVEGDLTTLSNSRIYDRNGNLISELGQEIREDVTYDQIPQNVIDAFLSIEDSRYFDHNGFDLPRFLASALTNLRSGSFAQGGSTLTMQLIDNTFTSQQEEKIQNHLERFQNQDTDRMLAIYHTMVKRSGFQTITALSNLYKRQFLINHQISFDPNFRYFSDQIFLAQVLEKASSFQYEEEAWYIKRKHNDPINEPSLNQEESDTRFEERCLAVECARKLIDAQGPVRYYLDKKLIRYVTKTMIKRIRRSQDEKWRNEYFVRIQSTLLDTAPRVLDDLSAKQKRIILLMMKNDLKGVQKAIRWSFGKAKLKSIFANKNKNTLYKLAYYHRYLKMPIKRKCGFV